MSFSFLALFWAFFCQEIYFLAVGKKLLLPEKNLEQRKKCFITILSKIFFEVRKHFCGSLDLLKKKRI